MKGMQFNWEISIGNVMSLVGMIVMATIFIVTIRSGSQLESQELRGEMKLYAASLDQLKRDFTQYKSDTATYNAEVRVQLNQVSQQITDVRLLIAGQKR